MKKVLTTVFLMALGAVLMAQGYKVGTAVEDFSLKNIDGEMVSMADFEEAEGIILVVTCNHCPYAKLYEDRLVEIAGRYNDNGFPMIAINPNDPEAYPEDSYAQMKVRADEKGFNFPYLIDETSGVAKAFGASRTPEVRILQKVDGAYILRYRGAIDDSPRSAEDVKVNYVDEAIEAIKSGSDISETNVKAVGCSIKWRES